MDGKIYWNNHTVNAPHFKTKEESLNYLKWRSNKYPLFQKICLGNNYDISENSEVILDYGCGPGNDIVGYYEYNNNIKKIWALDISEKAIQLAKRRLELHGAKKVNFICLKTEKILSKKPLFLNSYIDSNSVDYIQSLGVLHHTHDIINILKEFYRILKTHKKCTTMVYNKESIWYHLYCGYVLKVLDPNELEGNVVATGAKQKAIQVKGDNNVTTDDIFHHCTDGITCPIAFAFSNDEWKNICNSCGFKTSHTGNYYSDYEVFIFNKYYKKALNDNRLDKDHREFLENLEIRNGAIYYNNQIAGIGLCHELRK
jgi:SAM-dependent methyltransferase